MQEQGIWVDYAMVTPNDFQTALAGEPGNYFKKALGDPRKTSIRHIEEAHSAFGKATGRDSGVTRQQRTLVDTSNIVLDEIINGKRDCLLIATTDQPERFDAAVYRRFVEKGSIINISDYWDQPGKPEGSGSPGTAAKRHPGVVRTERKRLQIRKMPALG